MIYKKNLTEELSVDLFKNPTSEYRGTPFWAWNSKLEADELCNQIDVFKEMGLGGFHMHVRTGLENEYLSDEYMGLIRTCVDKAKKEKMLAWLYDEDRWPSGAAGGIVTKNKKYRQRSLLLSHDYEASVKWHAERSEDPEIDDGLPLLTCYDIILDENGYLTGYSQIGFDEKAKGEKWYLFESVATNDSWYNDQSYIDTMNPEAMKEFIKVTHERYKETVGDEFDETVPAIFTDEPQVRRKEVLNNSFDTDYDIHLPWTDRFPEEYKKRHNADIFDYIPELFWELPAGKYSPHRYYYHDLVGELFAEAFADTIGSWCDSNKIALTGHMMEEPTLRSQTAAISEAMRSYRGFGIPGIDMLCNNAEFTTAKQCQSAVHQFKREAMLSELYGVTGWDCDFRRYKYGGDWQAALGVTVRVPHLSWYAMQGEAKRDYPASIHYQSPWYKKYNLVEDHFARVNTALTRGKPCVKVGVIHPIESYWLHWGPNDKTELYREPMDESFRQLTDWLLKGSIDFDFISESLLPQQCTAPGAPLKVGAMEYDAVVIPGVETLRSTTIDILGQFAENGGKLILMGSAPLLVDALPSDKGLHLAEKCEKIEYNRCDILTSLDEYRSITLRYKNGKLTDNCIYQMREDNNCSWLFICSAHEPNNMDIDSYKEIYCTVKGEFKVELWNTLNGEISEADVSYRNGNTVIYMKYYPYDSFLFRLVKGKAESKAVFADDDFSEAKTAKEVFAYETDEQNVLVLDNAEYSVDGGDFNPAEEILKLDNIARDMVGLRHRGGGIVQPWVVGNVPSLHTITLRFKIESETECKNVFLALEDADKAEIIYNGSPVEKEICGYFTDKKINKIKLGNINAGTNTLIVTLPLGERSNTENMFILGEFGVKLCGRKPVIIAKPTKIGFGDLTTQGFPFYGGNITYKIKAEAVSNCLSVKASRYRGALIEVSVDGEHAGEIIYPPYILKINNIENGEHEISLKLYIHRYNCFGPLHLVNEKESWHGPGAWRSSGDNWSYEYVLRRTGILSAPRIL